MSSARKATLVGTIAVALVALVVWRLGPAPGARADARRARDQRSSATGALRDRLDRATELLVLAERRDSIMRLLAGREWPAESLLVLADPGLPAWRVQASVQPMRRQWESAQPVTPGYRVAFVLVSATSLAIHGIYRGAGAARVRHVLPDATDGRTCLVLRDFSGDELTDRARTRIERLRIEDSLGTVIADDVFQRQQRERTRENRTLGPCAFLAAFGPPGAAARRWLDSTSWLGAVKANWLEGERGLAKNVTFKNRSASEPALTIAAKRMFEPAPEWRGRICAASETGACPQFLQAGLGSAVERAAPALLIGDRQISRRGESIDTDERRFQDPRSRFLADLVRTGGRERFLRFWRANGSLPQVYEAIYGVPADVAWQQWTLESIGGPMGMGPSFSVQGGLAALGLAVVAIAAGIASFSRRQSR
ncbi:MAG: hypothetical protein HYX65_01345 [Gemmatimonadetes bacterium]|nr:hypothetical protein [Gemmatimonadota bacterium]